MADPQHRSPGPGPREDLLSLANPPLVLSAAAEALAGAFAGGAPPDSFRPYLLAICSALIFASGAVFGHYFDRAVDAARAPERPLPAGRVPAQQAWSMGGTLLITGVGLTALMGLRSAGLACGVAVLVVLYAAAAKSVWGAGFGVLAAARGANVLLGLPAAQYGLLRSWPAALPVLLWALGWAILRASRKASAPPITGFVALLHFVASI